MIYLAIFLCACTLKCAYSGFQDNSLCGIIAATNIEALGTTTMWSCTAGGLTATDPCTVPWTGITCASGYVSSISISSLTLTGYSVYVLLINISNEY